MKPTALPRWQSWWYDMLLERYRGLVCVQCDDNGDPANHVIRHAASCWLCGSARDLRHFAGLFTCQSCPYPKDWVVTKVVTDA